MPAKVTILNKFEPLPGPGFEIDTTSRADTWTRGLSPFVLGPCPLYQGHTARIMENGWQFAKLYAEFAKPNGYPAPEYWKWARAGWLSKRANRYPVGKGAKPLCHFWDGECLSYIAARKRIFIPLYVRALFGSPAWRGLQKIRVREKQIYLRDFDGYNHEAAGMSLTEVMNNLKRTMGHAFVILMMLQAYDQGAHTSAEILEAIPYGEDPPPPRSLF